MNRKIIVLLTLAITTILPSLISCKKEYLSRDEKGALFAPPTVGELNKIFDVWQNRDLTPSDYIIVQQADILSGAFTLKIVSFKVNNIKEYGALVIPNISQPLPVQVFVGGYSGSINSTVNSVNLVVNNSSPGKANILAIPALRGQSLEITVNGAIYSSPLSEGNQCDAFDEATDDVLAFLNLIQQTEINADVTRTGVRGGSRGGTVALLAGVRDTRVKRVVGVVSPTNMLKLTSQNEKDVVYQCQFLSDYKNGQATLEKTRNKMIASSPIYFAQKLPKTQLHMGFRDEIVPVQQGYDMKEKIEALGNASEFQLFTYDKTHTDIATNNAELTERIGIFLSQL